MAVPTITSFTPSHAAIGGTTISITGTALADALLVTFGGTPVTILTNDATTITAKIPAGASTGLIKIVTALGSVESTTELTVDPTITSFTTDGVIGSTVTIVGTSLLNTSVVKINGVVAPIIVKGDTSISVTVPATAATGKVSIITPAGTFTSTGDFTVTANPLTFSPVSGIVGDTITLTGTGLAGSLSLKFGATAATILSNTATEITAKIPVGAASGKIEVTLANSSKILSGLSLLVHSDLPIGHSQEAPGFGATPYLVTEKFAHNALEVRTDPFVALTAIQVEKNREVAHIKFNPPVDGTPYQN